MERRVIYVPSGNFSFLSRHLGIDWTKKMVKKGLRAAPESLNSGLTRVIGLTRMGRKFMHKVNNNDLRHNREATFRGPIRVDMEDLQNYIQAAEEGEQRKNKFMKQLIAANPDGPLKSDGDHFTLDKDVRFKKDADGNLVSDIYGNGGGGFRVHVEPKQ